METNDKNKILGGILARYDAIVKECGPYYAEHLNALGFLTKDELSYLSDNGIYVSYWSYGQRIVLPISSVMDEVEFLLGGSVIHEVTAEEKMLDAVDKVAPLDDNEKTLLLDIVDLLANDEKKPYAYNDLYALVKRYNEN